jgi:general secretion pathway protein I
MKQRGFTLIEVLVALFILTGAIIIIGNAWSGNFMRIRKSAMYNDAATLLERKMVETEAKYREKPLNEIPEEDGDTFGSDYPQYRWTLKSREFKMPDLTPILVGQEEGATEDVINLVKQLSETIAKAIKEVKISVFIKRGNKEVEFSATQYFVDYGADVTGGMGGAGAGTTSGSGETGGGSP